MNTVPSESSPNVIFVRGIMPRSGTNFLLDALAKHPDVTRSPGQFWEFVPFRFQTHLDHYLERVESSKHAHEFRADQFLPRVGEAWLELLAGELESRQVAVFKEPSVDNLGTMFRMFPRCKSIIIQRDGRDIVSSYLKAEFDLPKFQWWNRSHWRRMMPDEAFRIHCRCYRDAARKLLEFRQSSEGKEFDSRFIVLRFEELVENPRTSLTEVMRWANLDASRFDWDGFEAMPVRGSSFLRDQNGHQNFGLGVEKPEKGFRPIRRWKDWSYRRRRYFDKVAGEYARRLGYPE